MRWARTVSQFCGSRVLFCSYWTVLGNTVFCALCTLTSVSVGPLFYWVPEPSLLYPQHPSLVHLCSISNVFARCRPICSLTGYFWEPWGPGCPRTLIPFCRLLLLPAIAGQPSPNCDCGFWIHRLSLPLLWTPPLGLSTQWQILGSLAHTNFTSSPLLSLCLLLQAVAPMWSCCYWWF